MPAAQKYTPEQVAHGLAALKAAGGNATTASKETGIHQTTLSQWQRMISENRPLLPQRITRALQIRPRAEANLAERLDDLAHEYIDAISADRLESASLKELMIGLGIAIDKARLLRSPDLLPLASEGTVHLNVIRQVLVNNGVIQK